MKSSVNSIYSFINKKFPFKNAEPWDLVGLTIGDLKNRVEKVVVAIDLTMEVLEKAIKEKAGLVITHHPFIWKDIETTFEEAPYKVEIWKRLQNTGISLICAHTNYDLDGMSQMVFKKMGIKPKKIKNVKYGAMHKGSIMISDIEKLLNDKLDVEVSQLNIEENKQVKSFGILPGAGSPKEIISMHYAGVEIIITSDIKWSTWILAKQMGINLMQVSHKIEEVFVDDIVELFKTKFKRVKTIGHKI